MSRRIACLTLDVEADFDDPEGRIRLFEDEALLSQYVRIIERTGVKVTAFLVTSLLDRYGDSCRAAARADAGGVRDSLACP